MADPTIRIKVDASGAKEGARVVKRSLDDIDGAADKAGRGVDDFKAKLKGIGVSAAQMTKDLAKAGAALGAAFGALALKATIEQEKAVRQLEQAIRSTGGAAGFTAKELQGFAAELQTVTTFGDETIIASMSQLATFTRIQGEEFKRTTEAALDLATRMDGDVKGAVVQLGKALNDPIANLSALSRSGIQFSEDQKDVIKSLVETGRMADAQKVILAELEVQFGGAARAARDTLGGALASLKNAAGDLLEADGGGLTDIKASIEELTGILSDPQTAAGVQTFVTAMIGGFTAATQAIADTINTVKFLSESFAAFVNGPAIGDLPRIDDAIEKQQQRIQQLTLDIEYLGDASGATAKKQEKLAAQEELDRLQAMRRFTEELNSSTGNLNETTKDTTVTINTNVTGLDNLGSAAGGAAGSTDTLNDSLKDQLPLLRMQHELMQQGIDADMASYMAEFANASSDAEREVLALQYAMRDWGDEADSTSDTLQDLADQADPYADAWQAAVERIDSAFADAWKGAFDSFEDFADQLENAFKQLLAELAHQAITKPIVVQLSSSIQGALMPGGLGGLGGLFGGGAGAGASQGALMSGAAYTGAAGGGVGASIIGGLSTAGIGAAAAYGFNAQMGAVGNLSSGSGNRYDYLDAMFPGLGSVAGKASEALFGSGKRVFNTGYELGVEAGELIANGFTKYKKDGGLTGGTSTSSKLTDASGIFGDQFSNTKSLLTDAYAALGITITDAAFEGVSIAAERVGTRKKSDEEFAAAVDTMLSSFAGALAEGAANQTGSGLGLSEVVGLADALTSVNDIMRTFGRETEDVSVSGAQAAQGMIALAGGIDQLLAQTQAAYQFDTAFGLADGLDPLRAVLDDLGFTLDEVKDAASGGTDSIGQLFAGLSDADKAALQPFTTTLQGFAQAAQTAAENTENLSSEILKQSYAFDTALGIADGLDPFRQALENVGLSVEQVESAALDGVTGLQNLFDVLDDEAKASLFGFTSEILSFAEAAEEAEKATVNIMATLEQQARVASIRYKREQDAQDDAADASIDYIDAIIKIAGSYADQGEAFNVLFRETDFDAARSAMSSYLRGVGEFTDVITARGQVLAGVSNRLMQELGRGARSGTSLVQGYREAGNDTIANRLQRVAKELRTSADTLIAPMETLIRFSDGFAVNIRDLEKETLSQLQGHRFGINQAVADGITLMVDGIERQVSNVFRQRVSQNPEQFANIGDAVDSLFDAMSDIVGERGSDVVAQTNTAVESLQNIGEMLGKISAEAGALGIGDIGGAVGSQIANVIAAIQQQTMQAVGDVGQGIGFGASSAVLGVSANNAESLQTAFFRLNGLLKDGELTVDQYNTATQTAIDAYKGVAEAANDATGAIEDNSEALRIQQQIADERYRLETQLLQAQGDTAALRERELAQLDESNRAILQQIFALQDQQAAQGEAARAQREASEEQARLAEEAAQRAQAIAQERYGLEGQLLQLQGDTAALRERELAQIDESNRALLMQIYALEDQQAAQEQAARAAEEAARVAEETAREQARIAEQIASERYSLETRLLQAQGDTAELRARELAELDESNRALLQQIYALEDQAEATRQAEQAAADLAAEQERIANERLGLERQLLQLQGDTEELRRRELEALDPSNRALQEQIWALQDAKAANDDYVSGIERVADAVRSLREFADDFRISAAAESSVSLGLLQRQYQSAFDAVAAGDLSRVSDFTGIGGQIADLAGQTATSRLDYQRIVSGVANQADLLASSIETQQEQTERLITMPLVANGNAQQATTNELKEVRSLLTTLVTEQRNGNAAVSSNTGQLNRAIKNMVDQGQRLRVVIVNEADEPVYTDEIA